MTHNQIMDLIQQLFYILGEGGIGVPLLVAFITAAHWPKPAKQAAMYAVAGVVGAITYLVQNQWQVNNSQALGLMVIGMIAAAQVAYHGLWKQGGITDSITSARTRATLAIANKPAAGTVVEDDDQLVEEQEPDDLGSDDASGHAADKIAS